MYPPTFRPNPVPRPNPGASSALPWLAAWTPLLLMVAPVIVKNGPAWLGQQLGTNTDQKMALALLEWYKSANPSGSDKGYFTADLPITVSQLPGFLSLLRQKLWGVDGPNYWPPSGEMATWIARQWGDQIPASQLQKVIVKLKNFLIMEGFPTTESIAFGAWLHGKKRTGYERLVLAGKIAAVTGAAYLAYKHRATLARLIRRK